MTPLAKAELWDFLGQRIQQLRLESEWRQSDLADELDMCRVSIVNIEAGRQALPLHKLIDLCDLFGIHLADLVDGLY